jgi:hypothetical protein
MFFFSASNANGFMKPIKTFRLYEKSGVTIVFVLSFLLFGGALFAVITSGIWLPVGRPSRGREVAYWVLFWGGLIFGLVRILYNLFWFAFYRVELFPSQLVFRTPFRRRVIKLASVTNVSYHRDFEGSGPTLQLRSEDQTMPSIDFPCIRLPLLSSAPNVGISALLQHIHMHNPSTKFDEFSNEIRMGDFRRMPINFAPIFGPISVMWLYVLGIPAAAALSCYFFCH